MKKQLPEENKELTMEQRKGQEIAASMEVFKKTGISPIEAEKVDPTVVSVPKDLVLAAYQCISEASHKRSWLEITSLMNELQKYLPQDGS